jgi:hypothetical protein
MNAAAGKPDRILIVIVSAVALLVIVALAVIFSRGEPEGLDEGPPAGVVQRYSIAVIEGDTSTADSYLTESARSFCSGFKGGPPPSRVVLISTNERTDSATVNVSIVYSSPNGLFGPSDYEMEDRFSLVRVDGRWLVDQAPSQLLSCIPSPVKR